MGNKKKKIRIKMKHPYSGTAYIELPGHPDQPVAGIVSKMISLDDIIQDYQGPMVNLDFNEDGTLIGIEILVFGNNSSD